eukprot:NODE_3610_length_946_cov_42.738016_g3316_i0.p1 GENE.NODE_3610_length_946_cov_42.738016_g3316_i0~~NODE_3610_length_946_cov_42.738016_g3316_i0.p1  ORF type:complete len:205 (+),score=28.68 NODE_3610_length_946_cov_42.738016_g3316_i0:107-721(+)
MPDYETLCYWEARYAKESEFDWFCDLSNPILAAFFEELELDPSVPMLHMGCGNSRLSIQLYQKGFTSAIHTDFAPSCIERMRETFRSEFPTSLADPGFLFQVVDVTDMAGFQDGSFACVFEKSLLDALSCGDDGLKERYEREVYRVLRPGGRLVIISYSASREQCFPPSRWRVTHRELLLRDGQMQSASSPEVFHHAYVCDRVP